MNYKKAIACVALIPFMWISTFADGHIETTSMMSMDASSANFLAEKNIIVDNSANVEMYNLGSDITRREMLKVMVNLTEVELMTRCNEIFTDLPSNDWGCKYAETALAAGFIEANSMFRPNDNVTQAEWLKMVMQARGIQRDENDDWRAGYESKAMSEGVISSALDYNANAKREMIFDIAAKTYWEYTSTMMEEAPTMNIVETAVATDSLSTLVAAVTAADLVDTLSSDGPFTVFAPTNDAFAALPAGTVDTLLMPENKTDLVNVLTYHVVAGSYAAADVTDGLELTSVQGQKLMFTLEDGKVIINGNSEVVLADVATSNGTVHVVNNVLLPSE